MGRGFERYVIPYAVGLALPLLVAMTWSTSGHWSVFALLLRAYAAPIFASELFTIVVALREGLLRSLIRWDWRWPVVLAAVGLISIALVTAFLAPKPDSAILLTSFWIIHALFGVSLCYLCGRTFAARDLIQAFMVGFALFAAEFFVFVAAVPDWSRFDWKYGFMAFSHLRHAGYYLAAIAGLSLGAMAVAGSRRAWLWAWFSAALAFGIALWTGSRGAALAVVGAVVVAIALIPAFRTVRSWGGAIASIAAALAVVWLAPAAPHYMMGLSHAIEQTAGGDVTTGRTTIWKGVIGAIRERPLFGYGEGQMHTVAPYATTVQPHESILQIVLAWGLVGLACVVVLAFAWAVRALPAIRREQDALVPAFTGMTAVAILSLYDGALYYALPISMFIACGALIASRWNGTPAVLEPAPATERPAVVAGFAAR
jgi:O-antigen ligase